MDNISISVSFIAAILGIAYPILLQVITRLDEKYSSQVIVDLFEKEWESKVFAVSLKVSLILLLIWILKLRPFVEIEGLDYLINNSAEFLLIISTTGLVISFFYFVRKVLIYYTPTRFLPYLDKMHNKNPEQNDYEVFRAIADVLYFSIKNQNEKISRSISVFMSGAFRQIRDKNQNAEVKYPFPYYELVNKTIEELAFQKNKRLAFLEHSTAGSIWLLGEFENTKISDYTYNCIWRNFLVAIKYQKDDYIIYHWESAHQYMRQSLKHIHPNYSSETTEILNQHEINIRLTQRKKFLELHYALGGLLLYKKQYNSINRAFHYTQSIPPQYELLPDTMEEVFELYFNFRDPYEINHPWLSSTYDFPDLGGLNSDGIIKYWICLYIALLFVRQYSIVPHLVGEEPLKPPKIPSTQVEKRQWIENLDYFKKLVGEILENKELLSFARLDFITDEWCEKLGPPKPLAFIEKIKEDVINSFEGTLVEQRVSPTKVQSFRDSTEAFLKPIFEEYKSINNINELTGDVNKRYINGQSQIIDKSAFADDQDKTHLNFDSFLPEAFSNKFREAICEIFALMSSSSYLLNTADILPAIRRLGIGSDNYIIVSFGMDLKEIMKMGHDEEFANFQIIAFDFGNYALVEEALFILKKSELPVLNYKKIKDEVVKKYSLHETIKENNLYTAVVDLNQANEIRESLEKDLREKDLRKSVFMGIFVNVEVQWKKNIQCVQIKQASAYREKGIINSLSDVKSIE